MNVAHRRGRHQLTPHSRIGANAPRSARSRQQGSGIRRTHPHHLTASQPAYGLKVVGRRECKNVI
jgi:hypothetical protein